MAVSIDLSSFVTPLVLLALGLFLLRVRLARAVAGGGAIVISLALLLKSALAFASLNEEGRAIALSLKDVPGTPMLYQRTLDAAVTFELALGLAALGLLLLAWAGPSGKAKAPPPGPARPSSPGRQ